MLSEDQFSISAFKVLNILGPLNIDQQVVYSHRLSVNSIFFYSTVESKTGKRKEKLNCTLYNVLDSID